MHDSLTEQQMREALFGPSAAAAPAATVDPTELQFVPTKRAVSKPTAKKAKPASLFPKLRVTMQVTKTFEGEVETLVHEARTLSSLLAEQEARDLAKKKKFKYIDIVSVEQV